MRIVLMNGGLGNQTFQYIFMRYLEETISERVFIDDMELCLGEDEVKRNRENQYPSDSKDKTSHNGYELNYVFPHMEKPLLLSEHFDSDVWEYMKSIAKSSNMTLSVVRQLLDNGLNLFLIMEAGDPSLLRDLTCPLYHTPANAYNSAVAKLMGNVYYYGYWINPGWFNRYKSILLKDLSFRPIADSQNKLYERAIKESFSIGVHIRRGDFVTLQWALPEEYYRQVISQLSDIHPSATYFIFSDDPKWCKSNKEQLGIADKDVVFVEGNYDYLNNYIDIQLMAMCNVLVVGGSSFSYLASLLNQTPGFYAVQTRNPPLGDINGGIKKLIIN